MIARTWEGAVRADAADEYLTYLDRTGFASFRATPGNRGFLALRHIDGERCDYLILSLWDSLDAVKAFAGEVYETAVFYPEDDRFLVARDDTCRHFEVAASSLDD